MSDMQILNDVVLIDFIIGGSTGEKTVESDDFIREVGKMLPTGTFSWVSKYRSDAKRETLKVGTARRIESRVRGYFVPKTHAAGLSERLKTIRTEFLEEKADFLTKLPTIIETWANDPVNAGFTKSGASRSALIRQHAPTIAELDRVLTFALSSEEIRAGGYFGEDEAINSEIKGLAGQAAYEIADDVKKSWKGPEGGKTTSRVLGLVRRIRGKADAMAILSPKFADLREMCDRVLQNVPQTGVIEGVDFLQVSGLLGFCMKPARILGSHVVAADVDDETEEEQEGSPAGDDQLDLVLPKNEASQPDANDNAVQPTEAPAQAPLACLEF